jgi:hypothetical protein
MYPTYEDLQIYLLPAEGAMKMPKHRCLQIARNRRAITSIKIHQNPISSGLKFARNATGISLEHLGCFNYNSILSQGSWL